MLKYGRSIFFRVCRKVFSFGYFKTLIIRRKLVEMKNTKLIDCLIYFYSIHVKIIKLFSYLRKTVAVASAVFYQLLIIYY